MILHRHFAVDDIALECCEVYGDILKFFAGKQIELQRFRAGEHFYALRRGSSPGCHCGERTELIVVRRRLFLAALLGAVLCLPVGFGSHIPACAVGVEANKAFGHVVGIAGKGCLLHIARSAEPFAVRHIVEIVLGAGYVKRKYVGALNEQIIAVRQVLYVSLIAQATVVVVQLEMKISLEIILTYRHHQFVSHAYVGHGRRHGNGAVRRPDQLPSFPGCRIVEVARGASGLVREIFALVIKQLVAIAGHVGIGGLVVKLGKFDAAFSGPAYGEPQSVVFQNPRCCVVGDA